MNPLAHNSNWYMILHASAKKVIKTQGKYISKDIKKMMKGKKKGYHDSIAFCYSSTNNTVPLLEETSLLILYDLTDQTIKDDDEKSGEQANAFVLEQKLAVDEQIKNTPEYIELVNYLKTQGGFHLDRLIEVMVKMRLQASESKRANEVFAMGDVYRKDADRIRKRDVAGTAGLAVLGGALFMAAVPLLVVAPPVALLPIGAALGIGAHTATKATPGGLIAFITGVLQQRMALALQGVTIEPYYVDANKKGKVVIKVR